VLLTSYFFFLVAFLVGLAFLAWAAQVLHIFLSSSDDCVHTIVFVAG